MNMAKQIYYHRQRRRQQCDVLLESMGDPIWAHTGGKHPIRPLT